MPIQSIQTIEKILAHHKDDIEQLGIPSLEEHSQESTVYVTKSPYVDQFKLRQIKQDLASIRRILHTQFKSNKSYSGTIRRVDSLIDTLDEKEYVNKKLEQVYSKQYEPQVEQELANEETTKVPSYDTRETIEDEDLTSLRKRLLSGGQNTQLLDAGAQATDKQNEYHESIQENILSDLTELTSTLKNSAMTLSSKILNDDLQILNETNENMIKNSSLFKIIDKNLNSYLDNKSGGKISIFMLLKFTVALVLGFFFMVMLVKIIPKIG